MEVDGPAFVSGVDSSHCVWRLQALQDAVLQQPSNASLIEERTDDAWWDCKQLGVRAKLVEKTVCGDELLRASIMEQGLERISVSAMLAGDLQNENRRRVSKQGPSDTVWI